MKKGFTIIELLVVISVVALLTTFFVNSSFINIKRGRDARRKSDLESIRTALEVYKADCNIYPAALPAPGNSLVGSGAVSCPVTNVYMNKIPDDPTTGRDYKYYSPAGNATYQLCAALETGVGSVTCGAITACGTATCNYQVINP